MSWYAATNDEDVYVTNRSTDNSDAKLGQTVWASISSKCDVQLRILVVPLAAKCGGDNHKTQLKLAKWTHHGLALTTMRHTFCQPTHREPKDVSRNRHIAPRRRTCYDLRRNPTVVLRNFSRLHSEKHAGKPHRGTKTMSAQVGESHGSTMNRLSKSPTANHKREARLVTAAFAEKLPCDPTRPQHTSQKNMFSRAANFNCHDMLRTSLSSDTQTPLVSNTADNACPVPTAPPLARQRGNTSSAASEFASDGESNVESQSPQSQLS